LVAQPSRVTCSPSYPTVAEPVYFLFCPSLHVGHRERRMTEQQIDDFIIATLGKKWESISTIVSHALSARGLNLPAGYDQMNLVVARIDALVREATLEADGDIQVDVHGDFQIWNKRRVRVSRKYPDAVTPLEVIVPLRPDDAKFGSVVCKARQFAVLVSKPDAVFIEFDSLPEQITWFEPNVILYCEWRIDLLATIEVIREATEGDRTRHRVPLWVQEPEIPKCCKRPMFFVGQFDDNSLASDEPPDAEVWWHDWASFYIFTCPYCLKVKAIGQQN
jgi:hypothetical protein